MNQIHEQRKKIEQEIHKLESMGGSMAERAKNVRDSTFSRFPMVFVALSTFGLVATLYGFEKVIDQIDIFADNPISILTAGVVTLFLTGSLYKKLT